MTGDGKLGWRDSFSSNFSDIFSGQSQSDSGTRPGQGRVTLAVKDSKRNENMHTKITVAAGQIHSENAASLVEFSTSASLTASTALFNLSFAFSFQTPVLSSSKTCWNMHKLLDEACTRSQNMTRW